MMPDDELQELLEDAIRDSLEMDWQPKDGALAVMARLEAEGLAVYPKRARPLRRRPNSSTQMTPTLAKRIRDFSAANPDETQSAIAAMFDVNPGRVSEALRHKR